MWWYFYIRVRFPTKWCFVICRTLFRGHILWFLYDISHRTLKLSHHLCLHLYSAVPTTVSFHLPTTFSQWGIMVSLRKCSLWLSVSLTLAKPLLINICYIIHNSHNVSSSWLSVYSLGRGDCDRDSECATGLRCFHRSSSGPVPGCDHVGGNDYCYVPPVSRW